MLKLFRVPQAVITSNGELTPNFKYIAELRRKNRESRAVRTAAQEAEKKVLVLGAGFVSAPVVDYLTRDNKIAVTVGRFISFARSKSKNEY